MRNQRCEMAGFPGIIKDFKFHPAAQGFLPNDRTANQRCEIIAGHGLPVLFHPGHSGTGSGMPGGGGLKLNLLKPQPCRRCAADCADLTIIIAHPSWPWPDALERARDKGVGVWRLS